MSPRTVNPLAWNAERRSSSCRTGAQRGCRAPRKGGWSPSWPRRTALPQCTLCQHGAGGHFEEGPKVPRGPARSPRGIRWRPAVEGRLAAMAESAPARVRVLLARLGGAFGMAEPLAGAGLGVLGAAARAGEDRPPLATPGLCPPPGRFLPRLAGAPSVTAPWLGNFSGLLHVLGFLTVPTRFSVLPIESPFPGWGGGADWKL